MGKKRSMFIVVGLGCLGLMLVCTGGMAAAGYGIFKAMRRSGPYADAMRRVRASPEAAAALGRPIEASWMMSGAVQENLTGGHARLAIPVHGPKGSGTVKVVGDRSGKVWTYSQLELDLASGGTVDLRGGAPSSVGPGETAPPPPRTPRQAAGTSQSL